MLYTLNHILNDIECHVREKKPFSLVRVGDGDLKLLDAILRGEINEQKFDRSGIPYNQGKWVIKLYRNACNNANYTSSFEMYYTDTFWGRKFSSGTKKKVKGWRRIYNRLGVTNKNYCNPEIGHLLFLDESNNLLQIMKERKICIITCFPQVGKRLRKAGFDATVLKIPALNQGHYKQYKNICEKISESTDEYDLFLIGAGALGKGYANLIKKRGGVAIDVGQVLNTWCGRAVAGRFKGILTLSHKKSLVFKLTNKAEKFRKFI